MTSLPDGLPLLTRDLATSDAFRRRARVLLPDAPDLDLPERAVMFGTGAFLRGFVGFFLDEARRAGRFPGRVVAVGSTGSGRAEQLNRQDGLYTLVARGLVDGEPREEHRVVGSLARALPATEAWDEVLDLARSPALGLVFSNTTEVGIVLDPDDARDLRPPRSFPGKLTAFLLERARTFDFAPERGVVVLPCELVEDNGDRLRGIVMELAGRWGIQADFGRWLRDAVLFCNTLVDRIVPGAPPDADRLAAELGFRDSMLTMCEPYRLFVVEGDDATRARLRFAGADEHVVVTTDLTPWRRRKVRILNGGHTITVPLALLCGLETVADAVAHPAVGAFARHVMVDEIAGGPDDPAAGRYALEVLERFANPFIRHRLTDITLQQTMKMRTRVVPSVLAWAHLHGRPPRFLAFGFAAWLLWMRRSEEERRSTEGRPIPPDDRGEAVRERWRALATDDPASLAGLANDVCGDTALWGTDLRQVPEFTDEVARHLVRGVRDGPEAALAALLAEHPTEAS